MVPVVTMKKFQLNFLSISRNLYLDKESQINADPWI